MPQQLPTPVIPPEPDIDPGWAARLRLEFHAPYFAQLHQFLLQERANGYIFPKEQDVLRAFQLTPFDSVRVVILGQDPYHGPGQAHGLSFSVPASMPAPPSLRNIIKEVQQNIGAFSPSGGDLSHWARQGVLLLNATLTVRSGEPGSHYGQGWERFTDAAISALARERRGLIFLLWGRHAQAKLPLINQNKHVVLKAPHPSPLSAHRGFLGCKHFNKANAILLAQGDRPIDWTV